MPAFSFLYCFLKWSWSLLKRILTQIKAQGLIKWKALREKNRTHPSIGADLSWESNFSNGLLIGTLDQWSWPPTLKFCFQEQNATWTYQTNNEEWLIRTPISMKGNTKLDFPLNISCTTGLSQVRLLGQFETSCNVLALKRNYREACLPGALDLEPSCVLKMLTFVQLSSRSSVHCHIYTAHLFRARINPL